MAGVFMKVRKKLLIIICIFLLFCTTYLGIYLYAKLSPKLAIDGANGYYLYDNNEKLYTGTASEDWISLNQISDNLKNATIAAEDKNFYKHQCFDFLRIGKALFINLKARENKQGASTITQQYTKNLFLDFNKTWKRKIKEDWLTIRLESHYTKDEL